MRQPRSRHDNPDDARLENVNEEISPQRLISLNIHAKYKHWIPKLLQAMEIYFQCMDKFDLRRFLGNYL